MRYELEADYLPLWKAAQTYQDKRNDKGHAFIVTAYASFIAARENCAATVVIPAAILHDIGWSAVSLEDRMSIFRSDTPKEQKMQARVVHQEQGVLLAKELLEKVQYDTALIPVILEIISQHDSRKGFISNNEGAMRDADKLWRYDEYGFMSDYLNGTGAIADQIKVLEQYIDTEHFFCFESSRQLAKDLLVKLKAKYLP
ncbi:HD domain-containing protein [bacterium]|nr:HD domain-containing protein [bacterium]